MFSVIIVNPKSVLFEGEAKKVFLKGDEGEFEILEYHAPVISVLTRGRIVIDNEKIVAIKSGIARYAPNSLVILVEA